MRRWMAVVPPPSSFLLTWRNTRGPLCWSTVKWVSCMPMEKCYWFHESTVDKIHNHDLKLRNSLASLQFFPGLHCPCTPGEVSFLTSRLTTGPPSSLLLQSQKSVVVWSTEECNLLFLCILYQRSRFLCWVSLCPPSCILPLTVSGGAHSHVSRDVHPLPPPELHRLLWGYWWHCTSVCVTSIFVTQLAKPEDKPWAFCVPNA